ncbi:MAG: winged helix-turn-helix transcriptional regulator [Clostridiales bacterium]|jgi:DNA-binding MarR family transcriptional regulator|nr:winged helix-turn-helix transcriptional regulator [Clostridiales bacterium]
MFFSKGNFNTGSITEAVMRLDRVLRRRPPFVPVKPRVSHRAMRLLQIVSHNEGITSRELAEQLDIRPSSLTEMLGRLESDNLISRERDSQDLRVWRISLTEDGKKLLEKAAEPWKAQDDFSDILSEDEIKTFLELCHKLSDGLEKKYSSGTTDHPAPKGPVPWGFGPHFHGPGKSGKFGKPGMWPPKGSDGWNKSKGGDR